MSFPFKCPVIGMPAMFDDTVGYTETDQHPSTGLFFALILGLSGIFILYIDTILHHTSHLENRSEKMCVCFYYTALHMRDG